MEIVEVRTPFTRVRTITEITGESMTHQSHASSVDINNIIRRFDNTGVLPPPTGDPVYADVTELQGDLTDRINMSRETLDAAGRQLDEQQRLENEKLEKQKEADAQELAAYRAAKQSDKPPAAPE